MSRIAETFARLAAEERLAFMPYLMTGFPQRDSTVALALALEDAGADLFELGVPFSDPLADGPTVQRASEQALRNGVNLPFCIQAVRDMRAAGVRAPIVMMGHFNPFYQYGLERLCADLAAAGADGLIIPDLPPEEAAPCQAACQAHGLDLIRFIAPTTPDARIAQVVQVASGFLYCVALTGVTGARAHVWDGLPGFLQRVRSHTTLPLVVGFGISSAAHVQQVAPHAAGVISASALITRIESVPSAEQAATAAAFLRELRGM